VAAAGLSATPAVAATPTMPTPVAPLETCTEPALSQPFAAYEDFDFYTLAPGGDFDSADNGWELTRGASILPATQPDGTTGGVLDLPSTAQAVSPPLCITSDYPTARLWVRNLAGSEGVFFYVSYLKGGVWSAPHNTGQFHGEHSDWKIFFAAEAPPRDGEDQSIAGIDWRRLDTKDPARSRALRQALILRGVDFNGARALVSTSHTDTIIDETVAAFAEAITALREEGLA